jgi:hypothetical protein
MADRWKLKSEVGGAADRRGEAEPMADRRGRHYGRAHDRPTAVELIRASTDDRPST